MIKTTISERARRRVEKSLRRFRQNSMLLDTAVGTLKFELDMNAAQAIDFINSGDSLRTFLDDSHIKIYDEPGDDLLAESLDNDDWLAEVRFTWWDWLKFHWTQYAIDAVFPIIFAVLAAIAAISFWEWWRS